MDRDRRFDERRGGESYRPSDRPSDRSFRRSPRPDNRQPFRSPPPRNRSPLRPTADTWAPPNRGRPRSRSPDTFRPRSRSPLFRGRDRGPSYISRPRSPPRRLSPGRDNGRGPPRFIRRSRSPPISLPRRPPPFNRERSPPLKRVREPSPSSNYPPRAPKRERNASPLRNRYDRPRSPLMNEPPHGDTRPQFARPRSPDRRDIRGDSYNGRGWRQPSPSILERSGQNSAYNSTPTSRRSSPAVHDRMNRAYPSATSYSPAYAQSRPQYDPDLPQRPSPSVINTSSSRWAESNRKQSMRPLSPPRRPPVPLPSPHSHEPSPEPNIDREKDQIKNTAPPQPKPGPRNASVTPNPPPTQVQNLNHKPPATTPPSGPSAALKSVATPARGGHAVLLSAPTRPKGAPNSTFGREAPPTGPRDAPRPGPGPGPSVARRRSSHAPPSQHGHPPTGPRGLPSGPSPGNHEPVTRPPLRHGNSTSTTFPRSQRFASHLAGLPSVVPGGRLLPSGTDPATEKRLAQLEADKEKLLDQISEKQKSKRVSLREWDKLTRESATGALRSELAEGHLQRMTETEGIGRGVAY